LVNSDRLVSSTIVILRSLLDKSLHYNEIIRQTSSDRSHVDNVINTLEAGQLIMEYKISKRERKEQKIHSQARIMQLTDLGREFIHLVDGIKEYNEAFMKFERCRIENIDMVGGGDPTPSMLRSRAWSQEEIDMYDRTWYSTYKMRAFLIRTIFNALISRYAAIVEHIGHNDIARDILTKIVTNEIAHQLSIISIASDYHNSNHAMNMVSHDLTEAINEDIPEFYHNPDHFLHNHVISNQIKDVVASLIYLVTPKEFVEKVATIQIAALEYSVRQLEQEIPTKRRTRKHGAELRGDKELLDIFERLLHRSS
jgi:DNA-binding HxlR family transcriptional regulator